MRKRHHGITGRVIIVHMLEDTVQQLFKVGGKVFPLFGDLFMLLGELGSWRSETTRLQLQIFPKKKYMKRAETGLSWMCVTILAQPTYHAGPGERDFFKEVTDHVVVTI